MARPLLFSPFPFLLFSSSMHITLFFVILAILCVFSVITFLCGSDKLKKLHIEAEKSAATTSTTNSKLSNRALSMVKMLSWRKVQEGDYTDHDEEALWRKNILMGEKCRPLNFSGKFDHHFQPKN
ncbi:hypothetical protein VNO78_31490 [Psophocarpus tetragonolobus]|uniref:Transmembrane protein n=1 Tax=Psophocarpus tetragonolobus TaxID=3891 RepID=A0AAN9RZ94_PSOTE